jgi:hypothetical protein
LWLASQQTPKLSVVGIWFSAATDIMNIQRSALVLALAVICSVPGDVLAPPCHKGCAGGDPCDFWIEQGIVEPGQTAFSIFEQATGIVDPTEIDVTDLSLGEHSLLLTDGLRIDYALTIDPDTSTKNATSPNSGTFTWSGPPDVFVCGAFVVGGENSFKLYQFDPRSLAVCVEITGGGLVLDPPHRNLNHPPPSLGLPPFPPVPPLSPVPPISQIVFFVCPVPTN